MILKLNFKITAIQSYYEGISICINLPTHLKCANYAKFNQNCILQTFYRLKLPGLGSEPDGEALFFFVQPCGYDTSFSDSVSQKSHPAVLP